MKTTFACSDRILFLCVQLMLTISELSEINEALTLLDYVPEDSDAKTNFDKFKLMLDYWNDQHLPIRDIDIKQSQRIRDIIDDGGVIVRRRKIDSIEDEIVVQSADEQKHRFYIHDMFTHYINERIKRFREQPDIKVSLYTFKASFKNRHNPISMMKEYFVFDYNDEFYKEGKSKIWDYDVFKIEGFKEIGSVTTKENICNLITRPFRNSTSTSIIELVKKQQPDFNTDGVYVCLTGWYGTRDTCLPSDQYFNHGLVFTGRSYCLYSMSPNLDTKKKSDVLLRTLFEEICNMTAHDYHAYFEKHLFE